MQFWEKVKRNKIAAYFRCDFDYLIGQQATPNKEYTHISDMIGISEEAALL